MYPGILLLALIVAILLTLAAPISPTVLASREPDEMTSRLLRHGIGHGAHKIEIAEATEPL
jgi:hypothetical protein